MRQHPCQDEHHKRAFDEALDVLVHRRRLVKNMLKMQNIAIMISSSPSVSVQPLSLTSSVPSTPFAPPPIMPLDVGSATRALGIAVEPGLIISVPFRKSDAT